MERKIFAPGEVIFQAGDPGDFAYIVETGSVELIKPADDKARTPAQILAHLKSGDIFGELSLLAARPREFTARIAEPSRLLRIESGLLLRHLKMSEPIVRFLIVSLLGVRERRFADVFGEAASLAVETERVAAIRDLTLEHEISESLKQDHFIPYFQPIVALSGRETVGLEALVRWRHPQKGLVSPLDFIPVAEKSGLIGDIDVLILRQGWRSLVRLNEKRRGQNPLFLSVNLSADHFNRPGLGARIKAVFDEENIDPRLLKFEITESSLIGQPDMAHKILLELKDLGSDISLDDFGTGYSSLSYLHNFPIDTLKIDRSFIRDIKASEKSCMIVRTILQLAHTVGMDLVAEGIEDEETASLILALGCKHGQGYLFSRPVPIEELIATSAQIPERKAATATRS